MTQPGTGLTLFGIDPFAGDIVPQGFSKAVFEWCESVDDFEEVNNARALLSGRVSTYRALGKDVSELKVAQLYAALRVGELLPAYKAGKTVSGRGALPYQAGMWQLRRLAEHKEDVLRWIEEGTTTVARLLALISSKEGATTLTAHDGTKLYQLIYLDPPWRYEHVETEDSRAIENRYTTMELTDLMELSVPAADDCVMFMWATNPKLEEALVLLRAWKFEYRTNMAWVKDKIGMGYYVRGAHELLLIAKRGTPPVPLVANRPKSWFKAPWAGHSVKPEETYELIERMYPDSSKIEMFARNVTRPGWDTWGFEAGKE